MVLYLVKWNDGSSAVVTAEDEDVLIDTLDQLGDPAAATWMEYDGPLWIEFTSPGDGLPDGDVDPYRVACPRPTVPGTDAAVAFQDSTLRLLHPKLYELREATLAKNLDALIPREHFEAAVAADRVWGLPGSVHGPPTGPEH